MTASPDEARALASDTGHNANPSLPDLLIAHPDWARAALQAAACGGPVGRYQPRLRNVRLLRC